MKKAHYVLLLTLLLAHCSSAYYGAMEKIGYHKRDILSSRVEKARDSQERAKEQFKTALEKFQNVTDFDGGALEDRYKTLKGEYDSCKRRTEDVSERIESIQAVAEDLFEEWESELKSYTNARLRESSEAKLRSTKARYNQLLLTMQEAESKIPPVLAAFHDQVLFLKHNLNAKAISSLALQTAEIESDVADLVQEMERSINEADSFIESLQ